MNLKYDLELQHKIIAIVNKLLMNQEEKNQVLEEAQHEETLYAILRIHLYTEKELDGMIESMFNKPKLIKGFANKLKFLHDLELVDKPLFNAVKKLNDVRNKLAHNLNYGESETLYSELRSGLSENILKMHDIDIQMLELLNKEKLDHQKKIRILLTNIWIQLRINSTNILYKKFAFSKRLREEVIAEVDEKTR